MGLLINPYRFATPGGGSDPIAGPTRLYLEASGSAPASPSFDAAWDITTSADRTPLSLSKRAWTAVADKLSANETSTSVVNVLNRQFVSAPLNGAQTIGGTVRGVIRAFEGSTLGAASDARAQVTIRVVSGDGSTVRGTLLAADTSALSSEFAASFTNRRHPLAANSPATLTSVAAQSGDRIVVEIGARHHNVSATASAVRHSFGTGSDSDLVDDETGTAATAPWLEFSQGILFTETLSIVPRDRQLSTTAASPSVVPVGPVSAGWLAVLFSFCKDAALTRSATPGGFTNVVDGTGGTGAAGADAGQIHGFVDTRAMDGTESGDLSTTWSGVPSPAVHYLLKYSKQGGGAWSVAGTYGSDSTAGTGALSVNVTGLADPGFAAGDTVLVMYANPTNEGTFSLPVLTIPGCTFDTLRELLRLDVPAGNDASVLVYEATILTGPSSGPPTFTMTATAAAGGAGLGVFVRLRS